MLQNMHGSVLECRAMKNGRTTRVLLAAAAVVASYRIVEYGTVCTVSVVGKAMLLRSNKNVGSVNL